MKVHKTKSTDNVFKEIGFDAIEANNLKLRSELMIRIEQYIKSKKLTQLAAARVFRIDQPRLNKLLKGRIDLFTVDKLIALLARVNIKVILKIAT